MKKAVALLALVMACPMLAGAQANQMVPSPADSADATSDVRYVSHDWGWIGLLGLAGFAGLRRAKNEKTRSLRVEGVEVKTVRV